MALILSFSMAAVTWWSKIELLPFFWQFGADVMYNCPSLQMCPNLSFMLLMLNNKAAFSAKNPSVLSLESFFLTMIVRSAVVLD